MVSSVDLTEEVKCYLLELLRVLRDEYGCDDRNSLLTDRTFLVRAVRVLKAKALLEGREHCEPEDLKVRSHGRATSPVVCSVLCCD